MGQETGLEPATTGFTFRRSTAELLLTCGYFREPHGRYLSPRHDKAHSV